MNYRFLHKNRWQLLLVFLYQNPVLYTSFCRLSQETTAMIFQRTVPMNIFWCRDVSLCHIKWEYVFTVLSDGSGPIKFSLYYLSLLFWKIKNEYSPFSVALISLATCWILLHIIYILTPEGSGTRSYMFFKSFNDLLSFMNLVMYTRIFNFSLESHHNNRRNTQKKSSTHTMRANEN